MLQVIRQTERSSVTSYMCFRQTELFASTVSEILAITMSKLELSESDIESDI